MTNNTLPKALLLAEMIDSNEVCVDWDKDAAAELRRLHEMNQMLLDALDWIGTVYARDYEYQEKANATLSKIRSKHE